MRTEFHRLRVTTRSHGRHGNILPMAAVLMVVVLGFTALTVDVGFLMETRTQAQAASDGATLSAALELVDGWGKGATVTSSQVVTNGTSVASSVAAQYRVGELASASLGTGDVRFGNRTKNGSGNWVETWSTAPYNMVEVSVRRNNMPLFLAGVIGNSQATVSVSATAVLSPGGGFFIPSGSTLTCPLLPIALDLPTWDALINSGVGTDNYTYNANGSVTAGADGIKEVNIYPEGTAGLPPGNRGTVDIGPANNSTADLSRQIRFGPNASDLAFFGGTVQIPTTGTLALNGDTGLSAGIKDDLVAIWGQPRAIPIFTSVAGPGNNATYQIVKFVGIRIMSSQLTGSPSQKKVIVQPAPVFDGTIVRTTGALQPDSILAPLQLIH